MCRPNRRALTSALAAVTAAVGLFTAAPALASDAPPGSFEVDYDAVGTSVITKPNSAITLGPAVSKTYISDSGDGTFTADLALPPTRSTFEIAGLVPVSATVNFVPAGRLAGALSAEPPVRLTATARYTLKLTDVTAGGLPAGVGDNCRTTQPVSIPVATPAGQAFDLTEGGRLSGTYTIGEFDNCGLTTGLINSLVAGPGNTVSFQLSHGRFVE